MFCIVVAIFHASLFAIFSVYTSIEKICPIDILYLSLMHGITIRG